MQRIKEIDDLDIRIGLIQALIPAGLEKISEELQQEVEGLAGKKGKHGKANTRYGRQWGSVYLSNQKMPVEMPRVRNKTRNQEVPLESYHKMQQPYQTDELVFKKLLNGLTIRKYSESAAIVPEVFGLSPLNMSKRFKEAASAKLRQLASEEPKQV